MTWDDGTVKEVTYNDPSEAGKIYSNHINNPRVKEMKILDPNGIVISECGSRTGNFPKAVKI